MLLWYMMNMQGQSSAQSLAQGFWLSILVSLAMGIGCLALLTPTVNPMRIVTAEVDEAEQVLLNTPRLPSQKKSVDVLSTSRERSSIEI